MKMSIKSNYKKKAEIMKQLLDLYQQVENVEPKASRLIVENYIKKNEFKLMKELNVSLRGESVE